jgi:hypothetical protein
LSFILDNLHLASSHVHSFSHLHPNVMAAFTKKRKKDKHKGIYHIETAYFIRQTNELPTFYMTWVHVYIMKGADKGIIVAMRLLPIDNAKPATPSNQEIEKKKKRPRL